MDDPILVVDDDLRLARALLTRLRAAGYAASHADSGRAAIASVQASRPGLIILDIRLPDMEGFAVCESIRSLATLHDTPIIFLSGNASPEDRRKAAAAGGTEFLAKPCPPATLLKAIERLSGCDGRNGHKEITNAEQH